MASLSFWARGNILGAEQKILGSDHSDVGHRRSHGFLMGGGLRAETPKSSTWGGQWEGVRLPQRTRGLGERRKLPSGVRGGAPARNGFCYVA